MLYRELQSTHLDLPKLCVTDQAIVIATSLLQCFSCLLEHRCHALLPLVAPLHVSTEGVELGKDLATEGARGWSIVKVIVCFFQFFSFLLQFEGLHLLTY